jgi:RNase P subunit RPR2
MNSMKWMSKDWFHKLYLYFYARYTGSQEAQVKSFHKMMQRLEEKYGNDIPAAIREDFCRESRPLMPLTNIINFDTRVAVLFLSIGFGIPWFYFVFESTVLEAVRFHVTRRHERLCERITRQYTD